MRVALFLALMLLAACKASPSTEAENAAISSTAQGAAATVSTVTVTSGAKAHRFTVEVARTPEEHAKGLMFRTSLTDDAGMLFLFDPPKTASFWMKNTVIPLDILFIRGDGSIAFIAENRQPYTLEPVSAGEVVSAVLEIPGGRAAALGIKAGDQVKW